jgi:DHA1 family vesicular acetylcholine transporter-like MFS transporter 3
MAPWQKTLEKLREYDNIRRLCFIIACLSYLLDGMLNTVIVPIVPLQLTSKQGSSVDIAGLGISSNADNNNRNNESTVVLAEVVATGNASNEMSSSSESASSSWSSPSSVMAIGALFASKAVFQIVLAPVAGPVIDRYMYELPLLFGTAMQLLSTIVYCATDTYWVMFAARSIQGVGSAFTDPAAIGLVTECYPDNTARVTIICVLTVFISSSNILGPVYGGYLDEHVSRVFPFSLLAGAMFLEILLILFAFRPVRAYRALSLEGNGQAQGQGQQQEGSVVDAITPPPVVVQATPIYKLITDPYVLLCCGGMFVSMITVVALESTIALWMKNRFNSTETEIGFVLAPSMISFLVGIFLTMLMSRSSRANKQWLLAVICMAAEGVTCLLIPFAPSYVLLVLILMAFVFNFAITEIIVYATFPRIVDQRYTPVYGSIYSIAMFSYNVCYALAPIFGNALIVASSFTIMVIINALLKIIYAPLLIFLRNIYELDVQPGETQSLVANEGPLRRVSDVQGLSRRANEGQGPWRRVSEGPSQSIASSEITRISSLDTLSLNK